ncbi:hypothetical protein JOC95_000142 [Bacillus tianshenii]|uniref:Uncharacterized protein n=1 Tax=Sutcliffiella tianshenii TaxID=1463404 RepID=A0ABS2NUG7_9BACI|nr:hypothetical protein [Bacillus tianshenii]
MEKNRGFCDGFYLTIIDLICMIKVHKVKEILIYWSRFPNDICNTFSVMESNTYEPSKTQIIT